MPNRGRGQIESATVQVVLIVRESHPDGSAADVVVP